MKDSAVVSWERIDKMGIRRIEEERSKEANSSQYSDRSCVSKASDRICCWGVLIFLYQYFTLLLLVLLLT